MYILSSVILFYIMLSDFNASFKSLLFHDLRFVLCIGFPSNNLEDLGSIFSSFSGCLITIYNSYGHFLNYNLRDFPTLRNKEVSFLPLPYFPPLFFGIISSFTL